MFSLRPQRDAPITLWFRLMRYSPHRVNCPGSPPDKIIEGHTTSQGDVDAVVAALLQRAAAEPSSIPDGLPPGNAVFVATEIGGSTDRKITALPSTPQRRFIGKSQSALQAEADRLGSELSFIRISDLDSDGTCALVTVSTQNVAPGRESLFLQCRCYGHDVYEKRGGRWSFVRRAGVGCVVLDDKKSSATRS